MFLTFFRISQSNTLFTFTCSILILSGPITTPRNPTFLTFYLYFSDFTYRSFSANLLTTLSCSSSSSISTITLLMKLVTFSVLIKFYRILFIIVWNIAKELVSPKNITVSSNDSSGAVNAAFHLSLFFLAIFLS